jgi:hypothetical protein
VFDCCVDLYQSLQGFFVKTVQPIKLTHADILYKLYWIVHRVVGNFTNDSRPSHAAILYNLYWAVQSGCKNTCSNTDPKHRSHFSFRIIMKSNNYLTMVHSNTRASNRQAEDEVLDNQSPSGRPKRTVKAPQLFTFSSPNDNDSSSPSKPSAKKKRKKRKKPSERSAQENLKAMRESRARNLSPSSDEDDDLHKKLPPHGGVLTQYSADGSSDDSSSSSAGPAVNPNNNVLASKHQDTSSDDDSATRDDIDGQGPMVFEAVAGRNCDSQRSNWFWNALSLF